MKKSLTILLVLLIAAVAGAGWAVADVNEAKDQIEIEEVERATKAYLGMSASQRTALAQLDVLKALSDDEVFMRFNSNVSPCVVCPTEGDSYLYLVLPVRVFNS